MLKLNVGLSKKIGLPDYGSRDASINLELELDSGLIGDPDRLKERIRQLFVLAKASIDEELHVAADHAAGSNGSPGSHGAGNGNGRSRDGTRRATASQVRAIHTIADRQGLDLAGKLQTAFGTRDPAELSITEASSLIDELKGAAGNGAGGRR